jgi:Popeye protein conserved region
MDALINAANVLYVVAYFTTDMLRLRAMTLVAAACLATYFACQPTPLWTVVGWNLFFFGLNVMQFTRLLIMRRRNERSVAARELFVDGLGTADVFGRVDRAHDAAARNVDGRDALATANDADVPALGFRDAPGHPRLRGGNHRPLVLDERVVGDELLVVGGRWVDAP